MHPTEILHRLGGIADWAALASLSDAATARRLVASGDIERVARGRYALPEVADGLRVSHALSGTACLRTAALHHGWKVARVPALPDVTVAAKRSLRPEQRRLANFRYVDLPADDPCDGVTTPLRTLRDCLQHLPADEALAIADSALRARAITHSALVQLADQATGRWSRRAREVARAATPLAANPFESVLRHLARQVPGLEVEPQIDLFDAAGAFMARPDLVDRRRRLVIEADSFAYHGSRDALRHDCRRYTELAVHGWIVLRFTWEDVMHRPEYVLRMLAQAVRMTEPLLMPSHQPDSCVAPASRSA